MCTTCGCSDGSTVTLVDMTTGTALHHHGDGVLHNHAADDEARARTHHDSHRDASQTLVRDADWQNRQRVEPSPSDATDGHGSIVSLEVAVLAKNEALAERNRAWFATREIIALNLVSSPGSGKTTLLERTIRDCGTELGITVIEGDQATARDGERVRAAGARAVQVNTGTGCHLEARMIADALGVLQPQPGSVLIVENVGNLVCPALFDLGERAKVAIISVTEGDDKPEKYPHMFAASELLIVNKIDLLPYVDFSVDRCTAAARALRPDVTVIELSARTGEGMNSWYDWIRAQRLARV